MLQKSLPPLERIIYCLEDTRSSGQPLWLDMDAGQIRELCPEQLEAEPERFGASLFPLPPWSSAEGYALLRDFAQNVGADELQKILRSRRHVFKRYRSHLKQNPQWKRAFEHFRKQYFCRYLRRWYQREFPHAKDLLSLLQGLEETGRGEFHGPEYEESGASMNLLREDFVLIERVRESAEQFRCLRALEHERRALALSQEPGSSESLVQSFAARYELYREVRWLNVLELQSPAEETLAALFWAWQPVRAAKPQAAVLRLLCDQKYEPLNIKDYLREEFLWRTCPRLGITAVTLCLDAAAAQSEVLKGLPLETVARICRCELG